MNDFDTVREQLASTSYAAGQARKALDRIEAENERLRERVVELEKACDLAIEMQNDRVEEIERLREALERIAAFQNVRGWASAVTRS